MHHARRFRPRLECRQHDLMLCGQLLVGFPGHIHRGLPGGHRLHQQRMILSRRVGVLAKTDRVQPRFRLQSQTLAVFQHPHGPGVGSQRLDEFVQELREKLFRRDLRASQGFDFAGELQHAFANFFDDCTFRH